MAFYAHPDVLDQGPNFIKSNCNKMALISTYTFGDSYATVNGNILAEAAMTSTDFTFSSSGNDRVLTVASGKSDTAANASGGSATNHIAFVDTNTSKVLWVTQETSGQAVTINNPVNFPSGLAYTAKQPVSA